MLAVASKKIDSRTSMETKTRRNTTQHDFTSSTAKKRLNQNLFQPAFVDNIMQDRSLAFDIPFPLGGAGNRDEEVVETPTFLFAPRLLKIVLGIWVIDLIGSKGTSNGPYISVLCCLANITGRQIGNLSSGQV
jgi:hypothetical protein